MAIYAIPKPGGIDAGPIHRRDDLRDLESLLNEAIALRPVLLRVALRYVRNAADTEDAVQNTLLQLVRAGLGNYDSGLELEPFLITCTVRQCLALLKKRNIPVPAWMDQPGDAAKWQDRDLQQHVFRPAAEVVGIYHPGFGMHTFRRLNVSWRREVGATPFEAMKPAGHSRPSTTWGYTVTDPQREREHVTKMLDRLANQGTNHAEAAAELMTAEARGPVQ